jgi:hypothetical protein
VIFFTTEIYGLIDDNGSKVYSEGSPLPYEAKGYNTTHSAKAD